MITFSDRMMLVKNFKKWCEHNGCEECSINLLAYLQIGDLLNEKNFKSYTKLLKELENFNDLNKKEVNNG